MQDDISLHSKTYTDEINFEKMISVIWRRRLLIFSIFFAFIGLSIIISYTMKPVYQSSTVIFLGKNENTHDKTQYAILVVTSRRFLDKVSEELNIEEIDDEQIKVTNIKDGYIRITISWSSPEQAQLVVNKIAENYCGVANVDYERDVERINSQIQLLNRQIDNANKAIASAETIISEIDKSNLSSFERDMRRYNALERWNIYTSQKSGLMANVLLYQQQSDKLLKTNAIQLGELPEAPTKPNKKKNVLLGCILGLATGLVTAFLLDWIKCPRNYSDAE